MWVDMPCKKSPISVYIGTYLAYWHISHISHISCISSHICAYQHCIGLYLMSYYCCSILIVTGVPHGRDAGWDWHAEHAADDETHMLYVIAADLHP